MNFLKELESRFSESNTNTSTTNDQVTETSPATTDTQSEQTFFEFARNALHDLGLNIYSNDEYGTWIVRYRGTKKGLDFDNEVVRYGRSLIADAKTHETLMVAPPKSWMYEDFRKAHPNMSEVQVEDFPSGPMVNTFYHNGDGNGNEGGKWMMSTRSYVGAENNFRSTKSFKTLFEECFKNATGLTFEQASQDLDKNLTYSWVVQHPDFLDVIRPTEPILYLVEVRDRQNGHLLYDLSKVESNFQQKGNWKIKFPKRRSFQTWDDVDKFVNEQPCDDQGLVFRYNQERAKVRNPEFINARLLLGNHSKTLEMYAENRQNGTMKEFLSYFPDFGVDFQGLEHYVEQLAVEIHGYYLAANTRPKQDRIDFRTEIPQSLQTICFNIHQDYWNSGTDSKSRKPVQLETVRKYIDKMPHIYLANMIYSHKEEQKNTSTKIDNLQKMRQAAEQHHQVHYKKNTKHYPKNQPPQRVNSMNTPDLPQNVPVFNVVIDTNPHSYANVAKSIQVDSVAITEDEKDLNES
jgi:hypothetical protein